MVNRIGPSRTAAEQVWSKAAVFPDQLRSLRSPDPTEQDTDVMRQAYSIALLLVVLVVPGRPLGAAPGGAEILAQARELVASREYQKAATILEEGLPESSAADRAQMVALLRQTYHNLIKQAETAGKTREAAEYREDLAILEPETASPWGKDASPGPARTPHLSPDVPAVATPAPRPQPAQTLAIPRSSASPEQLQELKEPSPLPEPASLPGLDGPAQPPTDSQPVIPPPIKVATRPNASHQAAAARVGGDRLAADASAPIGAGTSAPLQGATRSNGPVASSSQPPRANSVLAQADQWFTEKKYSEAGQAYAQLAAQNELPAQRRAVWAYCRWVAVVALINAHPQSDQEWDAIEQEVRSIRKLTPGNWYGEYLQNRVAEARRAVHGNSRGGKLVVRGSAPDDDLPPRFPRLFARSGPAAVSAQQSNSGGGGEQPLGLPAATSQEPREVVPATPGTAASAPAQAQAGDDRNSAEGAAGTTPVQQSGQENGAEAAESSPAAPVPLTWHVRETVNFRIYYTDPTYVEKAAEAAEAIRSLQATRWGSSAAHVAWSPPCDIYLYPTSKDFARLTGQPDTSPGFSTMGVNGTRVVGRRVNLRADHPQLLTAILPHEVTHVVLADLFTQQQIPRWADEGMAVLAEPKAEQVSRASELNDPLREGRVFKLSELMAIDYPSADAWNLYYAQSVSLTSFLVELGTPEEFVRFVRNAQRKGTEVALREAYHINGFSELENRWQTFAHRQAAEIVTSSRDTSTTPNGIKRE